MRPMGQVLLWRRDVELKSDPDMPLRNRMADNWRPLISIADTLGWGEQARATRSPAFHDGMRRKLDDLGIPYSRMELPELGERRLFIRTPTKILLELVFRDTKALYPAARAQTNDQ
jgi:hypothetical protein